MVRTLDVLDAAGGSLWHISFRRRTKRNLNHRKEWFGSCVFILYNGTNGLPVPEDYLVNVERNHNGGTRQAEEMADLVG
nr:hypothetical protein [Chakrabartyella piscis]